MDAAQTDFYARLAHAIAVQFGSNCEVVVHDLETNDPERSIVAIENGHVTGRSVGDVLRTSPLAERRGPGRRACPAGRHWGRS